MTSVKPIDVKVNVKPVFAQLIHHAAYEGPCRTGRMEDLTPEADRLRGEAGFVRFTEELKDKMGPDAKLMDPAYLEWADDFVIR